MALVSTFDNGSRMPRLDRVITLSILLILMAWSIWDMTTN
jgi:hypothetical protein